MVVNHKSVDEDETSHNQFVFFVDIRKTIMFLDVFLKFDKKPNTAVISWPDPRIDKIPKNYSLKKKTNKIWFCFFATYDFSARA